ncbi:hypothetical protein SB49_14325 [Sediminicola sp. YIK13]|uniref:hypothetical protein n=1 Tax=Sediminicola sp. YIK13 TaxID=1453352 RepID=UPI0007228DB4|nr:hypothetical protein [Sediminicola sp. YIK13]ALM08841.1 hypothetical protein SB49_14325 [Sediminicola sp. YIK13]
MKKRIYLKFLLIVFLGLCWVNGQAQTLHQLVLTVDMTKPNSAPNSSFSAGNNTTVVENSSPNRFAIWAEVGDSVLWEAKSAGEAQVPVNVVGVNYVGGPRIFSSNTLTGSNSVKATIIRGGKEDYVYRLQYTIGTDTKVYAVTALIKTKK